MKIRLWGTRGSLATPGRAHARYGGNTSCLEIEGREGTVVVLDAGTGIRPLGLSLSPAVKRVDILLSHLHMDHIQGLGFFAPLFNPEIDVHIWGPVSATLDLRARLTRYLSPPLFPVHFRDLPCQMALHEVPCGAFDIGEFRLDSRLVCHPGPTVGYRISDGAVSMAYLPDHEPALGHDRLTSAPEWTSGYPLAAGVDLLVHDTQYTAAEYETRIGWGHSTFHQAFDFASLAGVGHFIPFHHDPTHDDSTLDRLFDEAVKTAQPNYPVSPGTEGATFFLGTESKD